MTDRPNRPTFTVRIQPLDRRLGKTPSGAVLLVEFSREEFVRDVDVRRMNSAVEKAHWSLIDGKGFRPASGETIRIIENEVTRYLDEWVNSGDLVRRLDGLWWFPGIDDSWRLRPSKAKR